MESLTQAYCKESPLSIEQGEESAFDKRSRGELTGLELKGAIVHHLPG